MRKRFHDSYLDFQKNKLKLANLMGVSAAKYWDQMGKQQLRNQEAEGQYVRKNFWGQEKADLEPDGDEDVGHTVLGDITGSPPVIVTGQASSPLPAMLAGAAMILGPALAAAGTYLVLKDDGRAPPPVVSEFEDTTLRVEMGQVEDYPFYRPKEKK